jgi:hypothetical protein
VDIITIGVRLVGVAVPFGIGTSASERRQFILSSTLESFFIWLFKSSFGQDAFKRKELLVQSKEEFDEINATTNAALTQFLASKNNEIKSSNSVYL